MSENELFQQYVGHVQQALNAAAKSKASNSKYQQGTATLVQQTLDLAEQRFDRISAVYQNITQHPLFRVDVVSASPMEAENAENLLAEAGAELHKIEQLFELFREAVPLWEQLLSVSKIICGNAAFIGWRQSTESALGRTKNLFRSQDPSLIMQANIALETAKEEYRNLYSTLQNEITEIQDRISRSGKLIRSSERAIDAAHRRKRTGGGRALKNGMSYAIISGFFGGFFGLLYGFIHPDQEAVDTAKIFAMLAGGPGFLVGCLVGWFRFLRPAQKQFLLAEEKQTKTQKAIEDEKTHLADLKQDLALLPDPNDFSAIKVNHAEFAVNNATNTNSTKAVNITKAANTTNNAASIGAALANELDFK